MKIKAKQAIQSKAMQIKASQSETKQCKAKQSNGKPMAYRSAADLQFVIIIITSKPQKP